MARKLETRDFELVQAICETGSLTRAATRLHVSQSAASHHLARIEDRLQSAIFVRERRRLRPTEVGQKILHASGQLLGIIDELESTLNEAEEPTTIRLATRCYTGYHWLPSALAATKRTYPQLDISICIEATEDPAAALDRGLIDVAIAPGPIEGDFRRVTLFQDEMGIFLSPTHRLASQAILSIEDLADETIYIHRISDELMKKLGKSMFGTSRRKLCIQRMPLTEAIIELAKAKMGVALLSGWSARPWVDSGQLVFRRISDAQTKRTWSAAYLHGSPLTKQIRLFLKSIRAPNLVQ